MSQGQRSRSPIQKDNLFILYLYYIPIIIIYIYIYFTNTVILSNWYHCFSYWNTKISQGTSSGSLTSKSDSNLQHPAMSQWSWSSLVRNNIVGLGSNPSQSKQSIIFHFSCCHPKKSNFVANQPTQIRYFTYLFGPSSYIHFCLQPTSNSLHFTSSSIISV